MKKFNNAWIIFTIMVQVAVLFGLEPSIAPLNPEFIKYIEQQENGTWQYTIMAQFTPLCIGKTQAIIPRTRHIITTVQIL
ncbi:MAG: hypothetical protein PF638_04835 [Candidatus Delongbacteria bacterium]|nr:hypothetical protein [Candidatus Delongbacteria bacterium]